MNIPPQISYAFGVLLIVMGALRGYFWGWKRRELAASPAADSSPSRPPNEHKRHLRYGVIWVLLGLGLLISTAVTRLRAGL